MTASRLTRRRFLQGSLLAGIGTVLAACDGSASPSPTGAQAPSPRPARPGAVPTDPRPIAVTGPLTFANWDGYIDLPDVGATSPTIEAFEERYAVKVHYADGEIEDNEAFVASIRPQLERGVEPGWDLVVLSDWMAARVVARGWAERIDPATVPAAVASLRDELTSQPWDPDQAFHYPCVSFATGVAWHREAAGRDLAGIEDLFDPDFAGRVTLLRAARDTLPMVHLLLQARRAASERPTEEMTAGDAETAIEFLKPYVDNGHVHAFTTAGDVGGLADGETVAALACSRDVARLVGDTVGFAYPREGWVGWSENLIIPRAAKNRYTAELMIDWLYDPDRAARITRLGRGISPVKRVAAALARLEDAPDPEGPSWSLLFPPTGVLARRHRQPTWDEETEAQIDDLFGDLTGA